MDFIIQFLVPFFGLLTAGLFIIAFLQMKTTQSNEKVATIRHNDVSAGHHKIYKEVLKVTSKLDNEIIPNLTSTYQKRSLHKYEVSVDGVGEALNKIGYSDPFISEEDEFFLIGLEDGEVDKGDLFKVYYFIHVNREARDVMVESHCYEFDCLDEKLSKIILSLNDKFKISGFSVENFDGRYVLKGQYLIDAPENIFSEKTLDFAVTCLFEAQKELSAMLKDSGANLTFIEPDELIKLQYDSMMVNQKLSNK